MKIILAEPTGFCFGVRRAVRLTETALDENTRQVYCLGPLIHNRTVVEHLRRKGVRVIKRISDAGKGRVIIRTHGTQPEVLDEAGKRDIELLDATCPFVKSSQRIAMQLIREGYQVVIAGDRKHPEIESLSGFTGGKCVIIEPDAEKLPALKKKVGVLAQTTCCKEAYTELIHRLMKEDIAELRVFNTICDDSIRRQEAALKLARKVEIMLVIGGTHSANTKRLFQICSHAGVETHHIESARQLRRGWLEGKKKIGIASGASTPDWIIEEIIEKLNKN